MKRFAFSRRARWCYGTAIIALLLGVALILCGQERLGESLSVGAVSFAIAFGIGRGDVGAFGGYEHPDQKDERPD
jgi:hypothetical protein